MKNLNEYLTEATWKSCHGTFEAHHANDLMKAWKISFKQAIKAMDSFDDEFGGPVEWDKDIPNKFFQPDAKVEYTYDPDSEKWTKTSK